VDLRLVSDLVSAPVDELMALNPSLLRMITPPDTSFDLHLPAGTATLYTQRVAVIPESRRNAWRYHRVAAEDTLASVARTYRVQVAELAAANQLHESDSIQGVEALVVPVPPSAAPSAHLLLYTARRGDTLVTIADRFGVSLNELRRWNNMTGTKVEAGRRLHVAEPAGVAAAPRSRRRRASGGSAGKTYGTGSAKASTKTTAPHASEKLNGASTSKRAAPEKPATKGKSAQKKRKQTR